MVRAVKERPFPHLLNFSLAEYNIIPPSLVWTSEESLKEVLVDREDDVIEVCSDVSKGGGDGWEDLPNILQLRDEVPPILLRAE